MFMTVEGIDGAGKSSVVKRVAEILCELGYDVVTTRAPGGTVEADKLRALILDPANDFTPKSRFAMFAANMNQLATDIILPAVAKGKIVISDRYTDSTLVYQILVDDGLTPPERKAMHDFLMAMSVTPDLTYIIDIEPSEGMRRIKEVEKDVPNDVFDSAQMEVWERRRNAFRFLAGCAQHSGESRYRLISGMRTSVEVIAQTIAADIEELNELQPRLRQRAV